MTTKNEIRRALHVALPPYDVKEAYVYGSYARGDAVSGSDIDLRLLCGDMITYGDLLHIENSLTSQLGTNIDILTCKPDKLRPTFYERIKDEEELLYEAS